MRKYVLIAVACVAAIVAIIVAIMWSRSANDVIDFKDCASRGYVVDGNNPRRCITPEGQIFIEEDRQRSNETTTFHSE